MDVLVLCLVMQDFKDLGRTRQRRTGSVYERWGSAKKKRGKGYGDLKRRTEKEERKEIRTKKRTDGGKMKFSN